LVFLLLAFATLILYIDLSEMWVSVGQGKAKFNHLIFEFEIPLILLLLSFFHFAQIENLFIRFFVPIIPIVILYLLFDSFYNVLGRSPYPSDFQNFNSLWDFSPMMGVGLVLIFLTIPAVFLFLLYRAYQSYPSKQFKQSLLLRTVFISLTAFTLTTDTFANFHNEQFRYYFWSEEFTVRENGKFSSFIYYNNQERASTRKLEKFVSHNTDIDVLETLYTGEINTPKNIHLIVLESFIDPTQLKDIEFSHPILAKELLPYLNDNKFFSMVTSPVYGGGTAQAEFELLTGIQALSKVNRIEFNVMQGGNISSFVKKLNQNNYKTIATIATGSGFFNSIQAYKSIGFDEVFFLGEDELFKQQRNYGLIFDGDLFEHNIRNLKKILKQKEGPIFNYVLGMYGHLPYSRNKTERPDIVKVSPPNKNVKRIANQFYYRTKAIAAYIKQLIALDKNSIIYITSDHIPPILSDKTAYKLNNKSNISLFINNGKTLDVSGKKYYELPWFIWDQLTGTETQRLIEEKQMEAIYFQVLSESIS